MKPSYNLYKVAAGAGSLFIFIQLLFSALFIKNYLSISKRVAQIYQKYDLSQPDYTWGYILIGLLLLTALLSVFSVIRMQRSINRSDKDRFLKFLMFFMLIGVLVLAVNFTLTQRLIIDPIENLPDVTNRYSK